VKKDIRLASGKILLRPYRPADAMTVYGAACESVGEVSKWLPWCHAGYQLKESKNWIKTCAASWKKGTAYEFGVFDEQTGEFLGGCGLNHIDADYKTANLGYWIRSSRTGQGAAPDAVALLVRFGFDELKLNRIEIIAAVENARSQRVAEKAGARREGILRNRITIGGVAHDAVVFSFTPQDFVSGAGAAASASSAPSA
jgi:ribosomal-protein-serine acetyltransferase